MNKFVILVGLGFAASAVYGISPAVAEPVSCVGSMGENVGKQACAGGGEPAFLDLMDDWAGPGGSHWSDAQMLDWARQVCAMREAGQTERQAAGWVQDAMAATDGGVHGAESRNLTAYAEYAMCRQFANFG